MMLLGHVGEMDLETQTLITNLFYEYWAFNTIMTFTDYTTSHDHNPFRRLPKEFSAFSFGKEMWLDLMVSPLSFFICVAYFFPLERLCLTLEVHFQTWICISAEQYRQCLALRHTARHELKKIEMADVCLHDILSETWRNTTIGEMGAVLDSGDMLTSCSSIHCNCNSCCHLC